MECFIISPDGVKTVSHAYLEIMNLTNLAKEHRVRCDGDCNIMLHTLRETCVNRILPYVWAQESKAAVEMIESVNWL